MTNIILDTTCLGPKIGVGSTATVYQYTKGQILKLANDKSSAQAIRDEYDKMSSAIKQGIPLPQVYELVEVEGCLGFIMEQIPGTTLNEILSMQAAGAMYGACDMESVFTGYLSYIGRIARYFAKLHSKKYEWSYQVTDNMLQAVESTQFLTDSEKREAKKWIIDLPEDNCICHGDPNFNNVMIDGDSLKMIDWMNSGIGNPMYDVAENILLLPNKKAETAEDIPEKIRELCCRINHEGPAYFLKEYEAASGRSTADYQRFILPLSIFKLKSNRSMEEKMELIKKIREMLSE